MIGIDLADQIRLRGAFFVCLALVLTIMRAVFMLRILLA
jgi:hypothetical protein